MTALRSLGISKPAGLSYLLAEETTQSGASAVSWSCNGEPGDELLVSDVRVIWTRYGTVHRVFTFKVEKEKVVQALFAEFPQESIQPRGIDQDRPATTPHPSHDASQVNPVPHTARALVVLLKTQAHIYFIEGSTHVVNLPFEVQKAFSTPYGLILQRAVAIQPITISFQATRTPANSFAPSQLASTVSPEVRRKPTIANDVDPFIAAFFKPSASIMRRSSRDGFPHHVYLRDPLTEVGIIGSVEERTSESSKRRKFTQFSRLPVDEEIIYVSPKSEASCANLLVAVSYNPVLSQITIWEIVETSNRVSLKRRRKVDDFLENRRRSSRGPGTGTTTPALQATSNVRESFGGFNEGRNVVKSRKQKSDAELANQLDAAFEAGHVASQSSRRISSLLARSDLATGSDAVGLTDPIQVAAKHGASFAGAGTRTSFGVTTRSLGRRSGRHSHFEADLQDLPSGDISDNSMDTDLGNERTNPFGRVSRSLQQEIALVKIHTQMISRGHITTKKQGYPSRPNVIVLRSPESIDNHHVKGIALYVHDASSEKVYCTNIDVPVTNSRPRARSHDNLQVRVRNTELLEQVIDVCKIGETSTASMIMLVKSKTNGSVLFKHIPWSKPEALELPSILLRRNPYQFGITNMLQPHREGGLKRVLSEGIDQLSSLRQSSLLHQFDASDSKGVWHRFELQNGPETEFVKKQLDICQSILESSGSKQKHLYQLWNRVLRWHHHSRGGVPIDDWRAFLVLICSVFAIYLPRVGKTVSSRRRKTGLLRSSSGAQVDTESFNAMMLSESKLRASGSCWHQEASWLWATESSVSVTSSKHQKSPIFKRVGILQETMSQAREFIAHSELQEGDNCWINSFTDPKDVEENHKALTWILAALHLAREEEKLHVLNSSHVEALTPLLAQIGGWLGCSEWDWRETGFYFSDSSELDQWDFDNSTIEHLQAPRPLIPPPSIFQFVEESLQGHKAKQFPRLSDLPVFNQSDYGQHLTFKFTPRTSIVLQILELLDVESSQGLSRFNSENWSRSMLETLPEGITASLRSILKTCQAKPPAQISASSLSLIEREDLATLESHVGFNKSQGRGTEHIKHESMRDHHQISTNALLDSEDVGPYDENAEIDRSNITRLIFSKDQRFAEAARLVHPLKPSLARCEAEPDWTDQELLEAQQELAKIVAFRTLSVSPGRAMLFYNARHPLLTERFPIHGFILTTLMKPSNIVVAAERTAYTEDKVSWAFFHAGVEAGLTISRAAKGINTSWILFNKPKESGDRHAGFLLGLGLNGHLKTIPKWVAFKYLTPKHTMTSIGLLLGLAASHIGSMDALITRLLSVHVTRMLPPGAAELNVSPLTQTTGILALGILYYNTQHRRMTEVMLSEIECVEQEEGINPTEDLRDEGYRLAAGFALGYINLGQGRKTKGLRDMKIVERLSSLVTATREIPLVHILDKATAGATIAIALIFLKTGDRALANKIDIPQTMHQFEYVRPDIFLLRTVARHLIMWDLIVPTQAWMKSSLPKLYQSRIDLRQIRVLRTEDLPLYNILAGLCLAIGLRFAGSGREDVRDLLVAYLDQFIRINKLPAMHYDGKLTKVTTRNCQDVVVLACAAIMAGTGDVILLRRYRSLHGRTHPDTPYGSHLAAHQAIGLLFLGGGTHSLSTSNLAVASMLCAFYPLFPAHVQDNKAHLQAFRHFWVFAAEARCLVVRDTKTFKPLSLGIAVVTKGGDHLKLTAPCLLPDLNTISRIYSTDPRYWNVVLDFANNPGHLQSYKHHQSMFLMKKGPQDTDSGVFSSTIQALNDRQMYVQMQRHDFEWVFKLSSLAQLEQAEWRAVLPGELGGFWNATRATTVIDDRLTLEKECLVGGRAARLWSLRLLFAWAERASKKVGSKPWLGQDVVDSLKARIAMIQQG